MKLRNLIAGLAPMLLAAQSYATITITTTRVGTRYEWNIAVNATGGDAAINSVHIIGPATGANTGTWITPTGWTNSAGASIAAGSYLWQRTTPGNVFGSWTFGVDVLGTGTGAATSISFDYTTGPPLVISIPTTPTTGNWAMVPVPSPGILAVAGVGGVMAATRRRRAVA